MASSVDLLLMECLSKFELISLLALIIEHIHKIVHIKDKKHGMHYGHFLNRAFSHFKVVYDRGVPTTINQIFILNT